MRFAPAVILLLSPAVLADPPPAGPAAEGGQESARAARAMTLARRAAEEYTIRPAAGDRAPLTLVPEPILKTSNPVMGSAYGAVFVWTAGGRPEAIATIFKNYAPARHVGVEFHSLAAGLLTADREGQEVWHPARAGVELKPVPGHPAPAESPAGRLRQMRALAGQFAAAETNEAGVTRDLRLLTQPIYRYAGAAGTPIDGALFAFVQGTDPEAFLMIEARRDAPGPAGRRYALARATYMGLKVAHKGRPTWDVPLVPWNVANTPLYDRSEPFTEFVFRPGEGVNPPAEP